MPNTESYHANGSILNADLFVCDDIIIPQGRLISVYFGFSGIFVLSHSVADPDALYRALRALFETTRVCLYINQAGLYDPSVSSASRVLNDTELVDHINDWIFSEPSAWDESRILQFREKLQRAEALCLGQFTAEDGETYLFRHGSVYKLSPHSSGALYYLTLFGGTLGLHRFVLGEVFTGIAYFFTAGLFGVGWLFDVLCLFLGVVRDKKRRYIPPLTNRLGKLLVLPVGFILGVICIAVYLNFFYLFFEILNAGVSNQVQQLDSGIVRTLYSYLSRFGR